MFSFICREDPITGSYFRLMWENIGGDERFLLVIMENNQEYVNWYEKLINLGIVIVTGN